MAQSMTVIECGEQLTIAQVTDIFAELSVAYEESQTVTIDVSKVERIDTAALQMLYSFQRDALAKNMVIVWSEATKVFVDAVGMLGMPAFYVTQ